MCKPKAEPLPVATSRHRSTGRHSSGTVSDNLRRQRDDCSSCNQGPSAISCPSVPITCIISSVVLAGHPDRTTLPTLPEEQSQPPGSDFPRQFYHIVHVSRQKFNIKRKRPIGRLPHGTTICSCTYRPRERGRNTVCLNLHLLIPKQDEVCCWLDNWTATGW